MDYKLIVNKLNENIHVYRDCDENAYFYQTNGDYDQILYKDEIIFDSSDGIEFGLEEKLIKYIIQETKDKIISEYNSISHSIYMDKTLKYIEEI